MSKGLDAHASEIGRLYARGRSLREIARSFDVSQQAIWLLLRRHGIATRPRIDAIPRGPRHPGWKGDTASYQRLHQYLLRHFPKTGRCEECGSSAETQHALIRGRQYSRDRADYRELCPPCHGRYDGLFVNAGELTRRRRAAGMSRSELGALAGVSTATLSRLENGRQGTRPATLQRLAGALGCIAADLECAA